jgi:hypothetical protein
MNLKVVQWESIDQSISALSTDSEHDIEVQREAIPIVFVPGIMGTRLQRKGEMTDEESMAGCPRKRWDPSSPLWMLGNYLGTPGGWRKLMLVGSRFSSDYLEVIRNDPPSDGFESLMADYCDKFLTPYLRRDWGPLKRYFDLPVYACGFNWTDQVENAGAALAARIKEIKSEAAEVTGICEKVIVITHSMGGLVSRWASEHAGASEDILGIIHAVQPVTGSAAAYWRMKAGFEDAADNLGMMDTLMEKAGASVLGNSADTVTPILANIPGGLSLLPNKLHRNDDGDPPWLTITEHGFPILLDGKPFLKPESNPYEEIYRVKAVVTPDNNSSPSGNTYWGLVDPDLLDPYRPSRPHPSGSNNDLASQLSDPWTQYLNILKLAESLHDTLKLDHHQRTFCSQGTGFRTPNVVEMKVEEKTWLTFRSYPNHGFRGFFRDADGKKMMAILQKHSGNGDGTVPQYSSGALNQFCTLDPCPIQRDAEHQKAYEIETIRDFTIQAVVSLCEQHFKDKHG